MADWQGSGSNGNVARMVKETLNSIGYVEVFYAAQNRLARGLVQNSTGNFIAADSLSISAAAAAAGAAKAMPADFRASITKPRRREVIPNLQLHMDSDSRKNHPHETTGPEGFSAVDPD